MSDEYLPMQHAQCGETAFSIRKDEIVNGCLILAEHIRLVDGSQPINGDKMVCGSCGAEVSAPYEPAWQIHTGGFGTVYTSGVPIPA